MSKKNNASCTLRSEDDSRRRHKLIDDPGSRTIISLDDRRQRRLLESIDTQFMPLFDGYLRSSTCLIVRSSDMRMITSGGYEDDIMDLPFLTMWTDLSRSNSYMAFSHHQTRKKVSELSISRHHREKNLITAFLMIRIYAGMRGYREPLDGSKPKGILILERQFNKVNSDKPTRGSNNVSIIRLKE